MRLNRTPTSANLSPRPKPWFSRPHPGIEFGKLKKRTPPAVKIKLKIRTCSHWVGLLALIGFVSQNASAASKANWQQLNIGPFSAYFQQDAASARDALTQAEQVAGSWKACSRTKDLVPLWPIKVIYTTERPPSAPEFVSQNGQYLFLLSPGKPLPLAKIAELLVRDNTPRLPDEVESGLIELLSTVRAKGSRVTWGGPSSQPADLGFALFQLLASRPEYAVASTYLSQTSATVVASPRRSAMPSAKIQKR